MATHSRYLAGIIPWTEEPGGLQPIVSQPIVSQSQTQLSVHTYTLWCNPSIKVVNITSLLQMVFTTDIWSMSVIS